MTRRAVCGLLGAALGLVAAATAMLSTTALHAVAEAPDAQAWWSVTNHGLGADPGAPSDVKPTDLYTAGLAGDRKAPASAPAPFPSGTGARGAAAAIAGLRFTVPVGATVDNLTLHFDGAPPSSVDVLACRTTSAFIPEQDGPWNDVPPYDCSVPAAGALSADKKSLVFSDIGALRSGTSLSFVIVPQYVDREVLAKPDANALSMRAPLPAFTFGGPASFPAAASGSSFTAPLPAGTSPVTGPIAAPALRPPAAPAVSPAAGAASPRAAATAQPASTAASVIDDTRARLAASLFLAAALLAFLALATSDTPWLGRLLGMRAARLSPAAGPRARGVGRFARARDGRPEAL